MFTAKEKSIPGIPISVLKWLLLKYIKIIPLMIVPLKTIPEFLPNLP